MPRFRQPSPALVLAFLALLVALSSSAGANPVAFVTKSLSGSSIKKHSIPLREGDGRGGGLVVGNELIYESRPVGTGDTSTGWQVSGGAATPRAGGSIIAYAVCASP